MSNEYVFEIWSDTFHEGEWLARLLLVSPAIQKHEVSYRFKFQPVYTYRFLRFKKNVKIIIFGDYNSWNTQPNVIGEIIKFGKPDAVVLDAKQKPLLCVEETSAVPTGNQALQRLERCWTMAKLGIPFIYLLPEFGRHTTDKRPRSVSLWIPYVQLKLSWIYRVPSLTLFYGSKEKPEDLSIGQGIEKLSKYLELIILSSLGCDILRDLQTYYKEVYLKMCEVISSNYNKFVKALPGLECFSQNEFLEDLTQHIIDKKVQPIEKWSTKFNWPSTEECKNIIKKKPPTHHLFKFDPFLKELENLVSLGKAWSPVQGGTRRKEKESDIEKWIKEQFAYYKKINHCFNIQFSPSLKLDDFPKSSKEERTITTSVKQVYLIDEFNDFLIAYKKAFNKNFPKKVMASHLKLPICLFKIDTVTSNLRLDPFTGQVVGYAITFCRDLNGNKIRNFVIYYPHQLYTQFYSTNCKPKMNKLIESLNFFTDLLITREGIIINPSDWCVYA
jgi:hypothetical protein